MAKVSVVHYNYMIHNTIATDTRYRVLTPRNWTDY